MNPYNLNVLSHTPITFPTYLAVEGPIGVGKTTLVQRLSERLNARQFLEVFEENPFLGDFYNDPARYAFQTEIFFLLSRFKQQETLGQGHLFQNIILADYIFTKSRLFASLTLSDHELAMYDRVYELLKSQILKPDIIVYLHAPVDVLMQRVRKRGRAFEANMDPDYLERLSRLYSHFFRFYDRCPVLRIDTTDLDFLEDDEAVESLIQDISEMWRDQKSGQKEVRR